MRLKLLKKSLALTLTLSLLCVPSSISANEPNYMDEDNKINSLVEQYTFLELSKNFNYTEKNNIISSKNSKLQEDILEQLSDLGAESVQLKDLPDNDPLKVDILEELGPNTYTDPNFPSTSKTTVIKSSRTYSGNNYLIYEFVPNSGHPWIENYSNLNLNKTGSIAKDLVNIYSSKALSAILGPLSWTPYELLSKYKPTYTSINTAHVRATATTNIKFIYKKRGTSWNLEGATNKLLAAYRLDSQGVDNNGVPFVDSSPEVKVSQSADKYASLYQYMGSTSTMQTSTASSISIKNKTDNFIIKTLNPRMTTVPLSAYY